MCPILKQDIKFNVVELHTVFHHIWSTASALWGGRWRERVWGGRDLGTWGPRLRGWRGGRWAVGLGFLRVSLYDWGERDWGGRLGLALCIPRL